MSKFRYFLLQFRSTLWPKPALTGFAAIGWVYAAYAAGSHLPGRPFIEIERDLLFNLLHMLASTMLTVAIFAVTAMIAAFSSVATTATPRATRIVMQDRSAQNTLAAFLSAFVYALVSMVAMSAVSYGSAGRLFLFAGYALIVAWVLISFIRWVDQVSKLGRMSDTIRRVEEVCRKALADPQRSGTLGARPATGRPPSGSVIIAHEVGYIQHIDMVALQNAAQEMSATIRLMVRPGSFVERNRPLAIVDGDCEPSKEATEKLRSAFIVGEERHAEADPRGGLLMLAEIADRALSPAINDPGTAIAVIGVQVRLLTNWVDSTRKVDKCIYSSLEVPPLEAGDLLEDAFTPIARDGAGIFEVGQRLQKAFHSLCQLGHSELTAAAQLNSRLALEQSLNKLPTEYHRKKIQEIAVLLEGG